MAGLGILSGMAVYGTGGAILGGTTAAITAFLTSSKQPDESNPDVQTARRHESSKEKTARIVGPLCRTLGSGVTLLSPTIAFAIVGLKDMSCSLHGHGYQTYSHGYDFIGGLAFSILGIAMTVAGSKLIKYGNTTVNGYLNYPIIMKKSKDLVEAQQAAKLALQTQQDSSFFRYRERTTNT